MFSRMAAGEAKATATSTTTQTRTVCASRPPSSRAKKGFPSPSGSCIARISSRGIRTGSCSIVWMTRAGTKFQGLGGVRLPHAVPGATPDAKESGAMSARCSRHEMGHGLRLSARFGSDELGQSHGSKQTQCAGACCCSRIAGERPGVGHSAAPRPCAACRGCAQTPLWLQAQKIMGAKCALRCAVHPRRSGPRSPRPSLVAKERADLSECPAAPRSPASRRPRAEHSTLAILHRRRADWRYTIDTANALGLGQEARANPPAGGRRRGKPLRDYERSASESRE